jgi:hypothetical protein
MSSPKIYESWSAQYEMPCVKVENPDDATANAILATCREIGAVRNVDGEEFVVELRDVGPELWSEESLRRSVGKNLRAAANGTAEANENKPRLFFSSRISTDETACICGGPDVDNAGQLRTGTKSHDDHD